MRHRVISAALESRPFFATLLAASIVATIHGAAPPAMAHGKEVTIEVSSFTPDVDEPLVRLYRAFVTYAGDKEPVTGAAVDLAGSRIEGGPGLGPINFVPLEEPGAYVAEVAFPRFGSWNLTLKVREAREQGEGETSLVENVTPPSPAQSTGRADVAARRQVLDLFFRFNWLDVANIAVRVSHTLAAIAWFGLTGVILVGYWFLTRGARIHLLRRLRSIFPTVAFASLALLVISGFYSGIFSSPIRPPGVFAMNVLWGIPFGPAYLFAFLFKLAAFGASCLLAFLMSRALHREARLAPVAGGAGETAQVSGAEEVVTPLSRLAVVNAVIGLLVVVDVVVTIYLHYISHLAVLAPR